MLRAGENKDDLILLNNFMPAGEKVGSDFWYNVKTKSIYYTNVLAPKRNLADYKVFIGRFSKILRQNDDADNSVVRLYGFNWDREKFLLFVAYLRYTGITGFTIWKNFRKPTIQFNDDG